MSDSLYPDEIEIGGIEEYETGEDIIAVMSELKRIELSDSFQNQFINLGGEEEPMVQFSSEVEDTEEDELVNIQRREEEGKNFLQVYLSFPYQSVSTFNETLNQILEIVGSLTIEYLTVSFRIERDFISINDMENVADSIDYELRGIRVGEGDYTYIIQGQGNEDQEANGITTIVATIDGENDIGPQSNEDFIKEEIDTTTRFVESVLS